MVAAILPWQNFGEWCICGRERLSRAHPGEIAHTALNVRDLSPRDFEEQQRLLYAGLVEEHRVRHHNGIDDVTGKGGESDSSGTSSSSQADDAD